MKEVLEELNPYRTGVADGIGEIDRKDRGAREMGIGDGAVEENTPVGDISQVGPEAGEDHPGLALDPFRLEEEGRASHEGEAREHDDIGPDQAQAVVADEVEDHKGRHDPERNRAFGPGKGRGVGDAHLDKQFILVDVPEVPVGGEKEIGQAEQDHAREEGLEEFPSFTASHGVAFRAEADVVLGGGWEPGEEEDRQEKGSEEKRPGEEGHPEFGHSDVVHQPFAHAFHFAAGEDVGAGETGEKKLGGVAAFQVAHHHAPDHPEGKAVAEDGQDLKIGREDCEEKKGHPGHHDEEDEVEPQSVPVGLGTEFHAEVLGGSVADDLGDREDGLGVEGLAEETDCELGVLVGRGEKRLAEGVHAEVGREGGRDRIEREDQVGGPVEVAGERGAEGLVHEPLR